MDDATGCNWGAVAPSALHWAEWDTETSLFNADTGETHLLSELPATTLRILCERDWTFDALYAHLASLCETDVTPAWQEKIAGVLHSLEALELVEQRAAATARGGDGTRPRGGTFQRSEEHAVV